MKETGKILLASVPVAILMFFLKDIAFFNSLHVILRFGIVCIAGGLVYLMSTLLCRVEGVMLLVKRKRYSRKTGEYYMKNTYWLFFLFVGFISIQPIIDMLTTYMVLNMDSGLSIGVVIRFLYMIFAGVLL